MKKQIGLFITGIAVAILYSVFYMQGLLPHYAPSPLAFSEVLEIILICFCVASTYESVTPKSRRVIIQPREMVFTDKASSKINRAVRDGIDGPERLVVGSETTTFREACIASWQFQCTRRRSNWFVKDDRGNDITNTLLSAFDGIATLVPDYTSETDIGEPDESSEYSDLRDSVEYYD